MQLAWILLLAGQVSVGDGAPVTGTDQFVPSGVLTAPSDVPDAEPAPEPATFPSRPSASYSLDDVQPGATLGVASPVAAEPAASYTVPDTTPALPSRTMTAAATQPALVSNADDVAMPSPETLQYARDFLASLIARDEEGQRSQSLRLVDALAQVSEPQARANVIGAYWAVLDAVGRAQAAADRVRLLQSLPQPQDEGDRLLLAAASADAEASLLSADQYLVEAQYQLLQAAGLPANEFLPWPADLPLVGGYRTNFDSYYAQRPAPATLKMIHHSLPNKLQLIERRILAMASAEAAADTLVESYKSGRTGVASALQALSLLEKSQGALLAAVVDYNDRIAEYSLATVGAGLAPERLVSTLIQVAPANLALAPVAGRARQASAEAPVLDSRNTFRR